jgi:homoprotocatechuate degradation regulator HpaR
MSSLAPSRKTRAEAVPKRGAGRRMATGPRAEVAPGPELPHRNLPLLLLQARESVLARFRPVLQAHGLTDQQWRIVRALHEQGTLEPRQIGQACCISSPSLTGVLQRMVQLGLVQRVPHGSDQRRVMVSLAPRGHALVARMAPLIEATYRRIEEHLGNEATRRLYRQLDTLLQSMAELGNADDPPGEDV